MMLDTHIWTRWLSHQSSLKASEREALKHAPAQPWISSISLWEAATLVLHGKWKPALPFETWLDVACGPEVVQIADVSPAVARELHRLPSWFHHDPADRIIVATARALDLPLMTHDGLIRRSKLVRIWKPG